MTQVVVAQAAAEMKQKETAVRVFVTGASGNVGSAVVPELLAAGHTVVGLARSDRAAAAVRALGAQVHRGDLDDVDGLRAAAGDADGVVHLAFRQDALEAGNLGAAVTSDLLAIEAIGSALAGSDRPFVGTNATGAFALAGHAGLLTEETTLDGGPRIDAENALVALAGRGIRSCVVRLPPTVHDGGRYGFATRLLEIAAATGTSGYVGDGSNRWPSTHNGDVARLYRLALESAPAAARLHAVAEEGVRLRDIAGTVGRRLGVPVAPVADDQADRHFGYLLPFVRFDNPTASARTRSALGWTPTRPGLLTDLEQGSGDDRPADEPSDATVGRVQ